MKLLVATLFLSGVLSAPFTNVLNRPAVPVCNSDASHFHTKKSLLYSYEGETITGLVGTSEVRSGLKLTAKCRITPVLPCMYMLQIFEAELLEGQGKKQDALDFKLSSGSEDLSRELRARDLYFGSHEGVITNIRPQAGEPVHVLNMKRGILSSFQLKLVDKDHTLTEVDVNGECTTDYQIKARHDSGRVKTVLKRKDLSLCKDRSETNLGIPVTHFPTEKPFSLLKSNSLCKFVMSPRQRIGKVTCEETHLFRPFSAGYNSSSGAMTTVRQSLALIGHVVKNDENPSMPATEQLSLKFEHTKDPETTRKNNKEVADILEKLGAEEGAKPDTARLFTKLIFAVRRLNMKALRYVWIQHYECLQRGKCTKEQSERYQKYIVDALSQCGTLDCAEFMISTITETKVGTPQSVQFLTGIALVGKPSEDMVGNILFFCQETPSRTAFLTLGTLMHKYCSQHSCDNLNSRSLIYQADNFLQGKLREDCNASTPEEREPITLALKAIGNAGRPFTSVDNILKCAVQRGPSFINVDAIQALRRMPCGDEMTQGLLNIFDDLTMDTEIRIETFLALMRCPSQNVIQKIADILDAEKNNQVGSFVWSHLTNALESTEPVYGIPLRDAISQALQGRNLRTFKLDHLRFSHAYEASYYNKKYEVGGSSQAQVVFHPDSYFPRSAKFNLTVDMLGASVNLLETAARFEGFETLIEQMFGPDGYFPDDRLMQLLKIKPTEAVARGRRSAVEDEMNEIKTNLEELQDKMQIERKNPTGALSLKVFGHELQFLSFEDIDWLQGEADSINVIDTLINIARGGKVTYTKSFMLLEADHEIPTGLGVPLKLAVNGSGVSSVTLKGKFDIRDMFWGKKKFDVRGFVTPSATIDISGKMTVDAIHASSGIHVNASLYTSTEINGNATYKEGEGIKLSVEPPTKPVYIVNVKSNLATFLNEKREKMSGSPRRFEHKNCANFTRFLGVNLCGHVSLPMAYRDYNAPYFPLSGDSSFGMVFHTTKPELARFEVETRTLTSKDENRHDWIFNVHVPGLTFGRKVVGNSTFQFLDDGQYLSVSCGIHDYKFGKFEAKYNNVTNRLHTKFSTPRMAYLRPITIETELFNTRNNDTNTQDIGIAINASYNNFTITDVLSFHKHKDQYGVKSKFTYWPKKHITTEAQFSMEKRSMYIKMDDSSSTNRFFFAGKFGKSTNRFYAKIGNDLLKKEIKMNGEFNMKNKKVLVDLITKPSWNVVKFEAYPRWNALENAFYMRLSHLNSSSYVTGYLGSSYLKRESTLKFNGIFMKKPFLLRASHYVLSSGRKVEWAAQGFGNSANASVEYSAKRWSKNNVEFSAALNGKAIKTGVFLKEKGIGAYLNDKTMELEADYRNEDKSKGLTISLQMYDQPQNKKKLTVNCEYTKYDEETTLAFSIDGPGYTNRIAWSYYQHRTESGLKMDATYLNSLFMKRVLLKTGIFRHDNEKGLRVYADVLDKEFEAKWSILSGDRSGMKFVARYMKKELTLQSTWMANNLLKEWRIDTTYDNKTTSLVSTYRPEDKYLCSEIVGLSAGRLKACLQLISNDGEKSLRLVGEGVGKTAEMKAGWIHNAESKGAILQMSYNRVQVSDFFVGLVTPPSYTGLRLRGTVKGKSVEALLKYKNTPLKRSLDLDLIVQGKLVTFESMLVREPALQGVQINMIYQSKKIGSLFALLHKKSSAKVFKIGGKAMHYGAEYKLSLSESKLEKKVSSMVVFTARSTHYKYGYSVSHSNLGTNGQPNHVITTRLHYAKDKVLTSIYQFVNSEQDFNLLSKMELAPGQFLTNKIAYHKLNRKLSIKYELLPGIGITYLAALINDDQFMGIQSNLTIMDYPMDSSAMLNKQSGLLTCRLTYCPVQPPIEFTSHLRRDNGIDFGFTLSALDQVWNNKILMDYSLKQLKLNFDVLPNIPIQIFAKMFENKQFVLNMTTYSAFSAELAGTALTNEEYQLVLKHKFLETIFEDFKLSISSLQHLNKLRLRWESKAGRELLKDLNATMQKLIDGSLASLETLGESAGKIANDTLNYLRNDGREKLLAAVNQSKEKILFLKELVRNIEVYDAIEKYSARAAELLKKLKRDLLELVDDMKMYGTPLIDTYKYMEQMVKEISSELSPYTKLFVGDLKKWVSRTVTRYLAVSICATTIEEYVDMITEKTQYYYAMVKDNIQKQVKLCMMNSVLKEMENLAKKAKTNVEGFTCNYNLECTKRNIEVELKKLVDRVSQYEFKRVPERLNKIVERLTLKYKEMENYVLLTIKEKHLQERAMKVLKPIINFLKDVTRTMKMKVLPLREKVEDIIKRSDMMVYYNKIKEQHKELLKAVEKAKVYTTKNVEVAKTNLFNKINKTKDSLKTVKAKTLVMYQKLVKLIHKLKEMSWEDLQVYAKNEIEINLEKLKEKLIALRRTIMEKVEFCLQRHADKIDLMKKLGKTICITYGDIINGRITVQVAQEKLELLLKKLMDYLKEQKLRAMDKIKALKLDEAATKTYKSAVELYRRTREDLNEKVTTLYPKVIEELKNLLLKIKKVAVKYGKLAKVKVVELRDKQIVYLKEATDKLLDTREILMKKVYELLEKYKDYGIDFVESLEIGIMKLRERYERELKEAIIEYKAKLITTLEKVKMEIRNALKLYRDMPIEDIYLKLRVNASETFEKLLGYIIGETLITYKNATEKVKEIKEFYQRNRKIVEAKWKEITGVIEELNQKYRALVVENYKKASMYYRKNIQPITVAYFSALKDLGRDVIFVSSVNFEQLKLWYDHVKYIKFKEFYNNVRNHLAKYNFNLKECCEKRIKVLVEEIKKIEAKIQDFISEVREESKNVIQRIEQINKDVKQDTIETFGPYERIVRNVLIEHKTKALKKLAPLNEKYKKMTTLLAEYTNTTERYVKRLLQEIKDLDRDEIMDMLITSVKRCPFLMRARDLSLKKCPFLMQVKESYEFIREGHLLPRIVESLNRCPFLYQVRTHKLWSVLKQEIFDHEFVTGAQELGKSSVKKLKELSTDYYSRSLPKVRELRDKTYAGLEQLKNDMLVKNEKIKKTIVEKREEINLKLRDTHEKLRSEGERLVEDARDLYELGNKKLQETIERVGNVSIYDIETRIRQYLRCLLVPVKTTYTELSKFIVAELLILNKYHRELQERVNVLRKSLISLTNDIRNQYEGISTKANEWGMRVWTINKSEFGKLEKLSVKILEHLEKYTNKSMVLGQRLIDEYVPYRDLLKMTPNQLIERLREVDLKAEETWKTVKEITERFIAFSFRMFKEFKDSVDPEKVQEIKEKVRKLLNNTRDQMHFLATEILETTVFVTKFYGSADTVYSAHPEMAQFADYQLKRFINCSRICEAKAVKFYYEARDILERLFAEANYTYHNKLPQLVKYIKTEIKDLDTANLKKLKEMTKEYLNISKEYVEVKYAETLVTLEQIKVKIQEYLMSKRSELTLKLNETKEKLEKFLKNKVQKKVDEVYKKLLVVFEDVKELVQNRYDEILVYSRKLNKQYRTYMTKYGDIISDLPVLAKNAIGRLPLILDMMERDLKTLMNDGVDKLREGKLYIQDEVFPKVKQTYMENVNALNKHLTQLKETTNDVVNSVKEDINEELPIVKENILNIIDIIRKTEIALVSGELELKLPRLGELRAMLSDLNTLVTKKYRVIYTKMEGLYQDSKNNSEEILERVMKDTKTTLKYIREDVPKFCESKITELRELAQPKLTSLSRSAEMALQELQRMRQEVKEFCEEKRLIFYKKCNEARQMVRDYVKTLLETGEDILEDIKKQISGLKFETKLKIEQLQSRSTQINNDLTEAVGERRKELEEKIEAFFNSIDVKKFISKYIDVEDLRNKTIEIKEDILNMSLVHDLVKMGESCYMEGRRLVDLAKESSEFALYVIKRIVKYSDVWEIVEELTNPFHWIPPSNSIAMIFGKPHVYTFDGQSYQFVGYKKPSCTYVLAHDFRDNNFTLMSQETALIVNTKSGFIKIHASGKVEATVSKDADGKEVKTTHNELPVEMMQMTVRREGSFIKIKHDTGLDIVCDLRHFLCTFNINKFYHGKLAGLLGTNNNEQYDEFLKPDKTIAKSIVEFANAWEVSGDLECKVNGAERKPTCEKKPSSRCEELFMSSSSPLAPYFKSLDPKPFYDACIFDTSDCKTDVPPSESFCNVTAAYTAWLREKGVWARQLHECVSCGSKGVWQKWTERGSKNVDVVLLIPETLNIQTHADQLPSFLKELETDLSKYRPRYAVVGFGGKTAVHRRPHIVTGGGKIFGGIKNVQSAIANMKFTTEAANAFEAIEYLANLPFLPGASKVVIMITDQNREAMLNAPLQKAIKELDMQGVIFNVIGPYFQKKQHRDVLGSWKGQTMMRKDKFQNKRKTIGLPINDYTRLAESSQGGVFNLKAYSKAHGDWTSLLKRAMKTTIVKQIDEDQTYCRQCVCVPGLTAEPVTICRINRHSRCS